MALDEDVAIVVLTTVGSDEQADRIASALVGESLAACVNIVRDVRSVYRWKGEVTSTDERLLLIKTAAPLFGAVRERIKALHSYEVPEIVAVAVTEGDEQYLDWVRGSVASAKPQKA